jgi:nitrous oxidase accessory protein
MRFEKNNFYNNGYGLKVMANCIEDTFRYNNFSGNTFDAATNGQLQQNIFALNYWDKYEGYDLDRNGIGDIPFNPVSLYSVMVEKMPFAVMLMHSFTVDLINRAEKNMPGIVPDTFVDTMPLTKKISQ